MKDQLLKSLDRIHQYTINVADAMPESSYSFKPSKDTRSFSELMNHIAYSLTWMNENYVKHQTVDWNPPADKKSKSAIMKYIEASFDDVRSTLKKMPESENEANGFLSLIEHNAHHRGQATTYLRCKGIVPPEYPF